MSLTAISSVVVTAVVGVGLIKQSAERAALTELRERAAAISSRPFSGGQAEPNLKLLRRALNLSGASIYRIWPDGSVTLQAGQGSVDLTVADAQKLIAGAPVEGRRPTAAGDTVFVAQPLGSRNLVMVLDRPTGDSAAGPQVVGRILIAASVAAAAALLLSFYLSNRMARPLKELAEAAADVARGDFSRRVSLDSDDEIGLVANSFNQMAAELGDADRAQREFFLSVSHELRTPLTAIQGYAEAIEDGTASRNKAKDSAGIIVRESKRLARLVTDLLDLGRIDAKRFKLSPAEVPLKPFLHQLKQNFTPMAAEADVKIALISDGETVTADHDRLVQVLSNLVENALRYTPPGGQITLRAGRSGPAAVIEVTDNGPGFEPDDLVRAFERQYLWRKYRGRDSGTGLGLAITKELVEAMGGHVEASSAPGGGARFSVHLPNTA